MFVCVEDVDEGHLATVNLALELEDLMGELHFLRQGFDEVGLTDRPHWPIPFRSHKGLVPCF